MQHNVGIMFSDEWQHRVVYSGKKKIIFKVSDNSTGKTLVVKTHQQPQATKRDEHRLRKEYVIGKQACKNAKRVVQYLKIETRKDSNNDSRILLFTADAICTPLSMLIPVNGFNIDRFLHLAIECTKALMEVHFNKVIHMNLKPKKLLLNEDGCILITDFAASELRETIKATKHKPSGSPRYNSPELTGRTNIEIDYRTDFYSLGVTFYQLLTGKLPFNSQDPSQLIYMHTTQQPPPLTNVPTVVEDIVLRLLQKDPENRYQSCRGLLFDLEECQRRTKWGEIEPFKIGTMDYADFSHTISNGFYGRGAERDRLNNAFNRAIVTGKSEMILISGESGIGKSTFIYKFYHQRVERGFFAYGKFEQDIQTKLYSAIMDALRGVISQICEDRNEMEKWRIKILHAISNNGQILIELLPELEEVIGKQNLVEKLGTKETKSRLDKTLCNFVNILGSVGSPLILFLDDLQCADRDSVMLIESLVTTNENLFFIGAYRSNEISKNTNMTQMIERMKELVKVETLELRPIEPKQVEKWVQDILVGRTKRRSSFPFNSDVPDSNKELAKLIHKKTGGNPYFIQLYMSALYRDGVIVPDGTLWKWSRQELESTMMNSNLEQLLEQRVARLPLKTRTTLQWGSCMGINFDLLMVTHVMNLQLEDVIKSLQSAIDLSMITIAKDVIQFTHDRIREAFYVSIPDKARMKFHHSIGMMLLTQSLDNKGRLLAIDHINKGRTVIDDSVQERFDMAERNLWASKQSQEAGSHSASLKYALAGVEWIKNTKSKEELWNDHFELMFALHYEIADNYLLLSEFKEFEPVANELLEHAKTNLEIGKVQHIRMMSASMQKDFTKAVEIGSFMIGLYGLEFPINNPERIGELKIKAHEEFETIFRQLERCDDGHLDLKKLVKKLDEETVILYEFLVTICFAGIFADTELAALMCVTSLNIMLTKGINAKAATIAAQYAQTLIQMKKYDLAKELSIIALECANLFKESVVDCVRATHFYNLLVRHWFRPVKEVLASARDLYQRGISTGEMFMSAFALTTEPMVQLFHGFNLTQTHRSATSVFNIAQHHKIVIIEETTSVLVLICDLWQNRFVQEPDVVLQEAMSKYKINSIKTVISAAVSWLSFVYGEDFDPQKSTLSAIEHVNNELTKIETNYEFVKYRSTLLCCMYNLFYTTLQLLRLYRALNGVQGAEELQESVKTKIYEKEQDLQEWAKYCPQNYLDNLLLVRAEIAAYITCEKLKAIELYEQSIEHAKAEDKKSDAAVAMELAGKYLAKQNMQRLSSINLQDAYDTYKEWGGVLKTEQMEKQYKTLRTRTETHGPVHVRESSFDVKRIVQATQLISSGINFDDLLTNMTNEIVRILGATKCLIVIDSVIRTKFTNGEVTLCNTPVNAIDLSMYALNRVKTTLEPIIVGSAYESDITLLTKDPYIAENKILSLICTPIQYNKNLKAIIYVENNVTKDSFTDHQVDMLDIVATQMGISLQNMHAFDAQMIMAQQNIEQEARTKQEIMYAKQQEDFVDRICHEIRNPIQGILGSCDVIFQTLEELKQGSTIDMIESLYSCVESIQTCGRYQKVITDDVLTLSKLDVGRITLVKKLVSPMALLLHVEQMFTGDVKKKNIYLKHDIPEEWRNIVINADNVRISQVLINLVSNAIKFTTRGGVTIGYTVNDSSLVFTVSDTGLGIEPTDQKYIFGRFRQAKQAQTSYTGSGLGLSICKRLAELMNGDLSVASKTIEQPVGSCFKFQFECEMATDEQTKLFYEHQDLPKVHTRTTPLHVLVVEDNDINRRVMLKMLTSLNCTCEGAINGADGLVKYKKENWDLILMDVSMPVMNGLECTRRIREEEKITKKKVRIVGLSGNARQEHYEEAINSGMDAYLVKPVQKNDIALVIKDVE